MINLSVIQTMFGFFHVIYLPYIMALKYKTSVLCWKRKTGKQKKNSSSDHYFVTNCGSELEIKFNRCYLKKTLSVIVQYEIGVAINNSFTRCGLLNNTEVL